MHAGDDVNFYFRQPREALQQGLRRGTEAGDGMGVIAFVVAPVGGEDGDAQRFHGTVNSTRIKSDPPLSCDAARADIFFQPPRNAGARNKISFHKTARATCTFGP